jgi:hypothetical protein
MVHVGGGACKRLAGEQDAASAGDGLVEASSQWLVVKSVASPATRASFTVAALSFFQWLHAGCAMTLGYEYRGTRARAPKRCWSYCNRPSVPSGYHSVLQAIAVMLQ